MNGVMRSHFQYVIDESDIGGKLQDRTIHQQV